MIRISGFLAALVALALALPAAAGVNFGRNVRIGGHDFSRQHFDRKHRGLIYLYKGQPRDPGCRWHSDGRGGRVKVCHLRQK